VGEDHRVQEADAPGQVWSDELRGRAEQSCPEEERTCLYQRQAEALQQPQGQQRVDDEAARERVDAEQHRQAHHDTP